MMSLRGRGDVSSGARSARGGHRRAEAVIYRELLERAHTTTSQATSSSSSAAATASNNFTLYTTQPDITTMSTTQAALDPYSVKAHNDDLSPQEKIEGLHAIVKKVKTGLFTTRTADGHLHARAMAPAGRTFPFSICVVHTRRVFRPYDWSLRSSQSSLTEPQYSNRQTGPTHLLFHDHPVRLVLVQIPSEWTARQLPHRAPHHVYDPTG